MLNALAAKVRIRWSGQEHKSCQRHTGRSSTRQCLQSGQWGSRTDSPGLRGECRVGQEWAGLGRCTPILVKILEPTLKGGVSNCIKVLKLAQSYPTNCQNVCASRPGYASNVWHFCWHASRPKHMCRNIQGFYDAHLVSLHSR